MFHIARAEISTLDVPGNIDLTRYKFLLFIVCGTIYSTDVHVLS